jgi:hypothetical protein
VDFDAPAAGSGDDQPVWVSQSATNAASPAPSSPTPAQDAKPVAASDERAPNGAALSTNDALAVDGPTTASDLEAAIATILAVGDPAVLAEQLHSSAGAELAPRCLASGQRLVRLGQLLRTLA